MITGGLFELHRRQENGLPLFASVDANACKVFVVQRQQMFAVDAVPRYGVRKRLEPEEYEPLRTLAGGPRTRVCGYACGDGVMFTGKSTRRVTFT